MPELIDRAVPADLHAEKCVLGSMLRDRTAVMLATPILTPEAFFLPEHRRTYEAILALHDQGKDTNLVAVAHELKKDWPTDDAQGPHGWIGSLVTSVSTHVNAEHYAVIVRDAWHLRRVIQACNETIEAAYTNGAEAQSVLTDIERKVFDLSQTKTIKRPELLSDCLKEAARQLKSEQTGQNLGLETGFCELDELTGGLQAGELIIVAGRPSMGKTAFGLNLAEYITVDCRQPALFFSLEMTRQQLTQRLICSRAKIDSRRMAKGMLHEDERNRGLLAIEVVTPAPLFIDDSSSPDIFELRTKARYTALREKIRVVFVDYLQLVSGNARTREQEVSAVSRGLKAMAKELNIPVVALAQLNRGVEGRDTHRPRMSDLRESGSIEQEADVILLLHREDYYRDTGNETSETTDGVADVIIAKQRNGPVGTTQLQFSKKYTRFGNLARGYEPAQYGKPDDSVF